MKKKTILWIAAAVLMIGALVLAYYLGFLRGKDSKSEPPAEEEITDTAGKNQPGGYYGNQSGKSWYEKGYNGQNSDGKNNLWSKYRSNSSDGGEDSSYYRKHQQNSGDGSDIWNRMQGVTQDEQDTEETAPEPEETIQESEEVQAPVEETVQDGE